MKSSKKILKTPSSKRRNDERDLKERRHDEFARAVIDEIDSIYSGHKRLRAAPLRIKAMERLLPAGDAVPGASNWVQMGPQALPNGQSLGGAVRLLVTGRITGIAIHPSLPSTMYISAARGGVWKTVDDGASWTPTSDNEISLAMGALGMAPSAPDTLYAGTGEGNIFYLVTTSPLNSLNESYQGSGLLKTTNGGNNWALQGQTEFSGAAFYAIAVHPTDPDNAYAATSRGVYRTTNGATWALVGGGLPTISGSIIAATDVIFDPTDGNKAWAAFWGAGIYECSNAAAASPTWSLVNGAPTTNLSRISLAISPSSPSTLFALAADSNINYKGVYVTNGGIGGAWAQLTYSGTTPTITSSRCIIKVDISTPDIVYFGGTSLHKLARNTMTNTWSATDIGQNIHADNRTFTPHPTLHLTIFAGTDGGIYKSTDGGSNWSDRINRGLNITQFEFLDQHASQPAYAFSGTQDNGTDQYRTGEVFYHAADGDGAAVAIDQGDPRNVMIEHFSISPERSIQAGKLGTFNSISSGLAGPSLFYPPMVLDAANQSRIAFGATKVFLDGAQGTSGWPTQISLPSIAGRVSALAYVNDNLVYAGSSSGEVYRLVNSGGWTATAIHAAPLPARWIWDVVVSAADPNVITIAVGGFGSGHVWRGVVNGAGTAAAWSDLSGTGTNILPDAPANSLVIDPSLPNTIFAGTDVGVFKTVDDGANWAAYREALPNVAVYDLKINNVNRLLRAATHGRGMWEREIDSTISPDSVIYVRDNVMHTGRGTPPSNIPSLIEDQLHHVLLNDLVYWWQCSDAKIDAPEGSPPDFQMPISDVDFVAYEATLSHRNPQRGRVNRVYVQVHNRGIQSASVTVKILFADATSFLPDLPADFWTAFPGNSANTTVWSPIGAAQTFTVAAGIPTIFEWDWAPPTTAAQHSCLLVVADSPADPIPAANKVFDIATLVTTERHVGLKNLHVVDPPPADGGDALIIPFRFRTHERTDVLRIEGVRLKNWNVGIVFPTGVGRQLKTEQKPVRIPRQISKQLLECAGKEARLFEDALMWPVVSRKQRLILTGFPFIKKSAPTFLVLTRKRGAAAGTINVVQFAGDRVIGGNTIVIRSPRKASGLERRT
jgi:photosystem II stability/assembly factor-like uncharacterized protein